MSVVSRPVATGKTRTCPHCKAVILESLTICPGCMHHLRFDSEAAKRQVAANTALRVEGVIRHPPLEEAWEYYVVIAVRNDRGEEVTRQVVNVGALQPAEKRTFCLSVEVLPPQAPPEEVVLPVQDMQPAATAPVMAAPKPSAPVSAAQAAGLKPPQPGAPAPRFGSAASRPAAPTATVRGQGTPGAQPPAPPGGGQPPSQSPASQSPQARPTGSQPAPAAQPSPAPKPGVKPLPPGGPKRH
jgi:hypothetical protein